MKSIKILFTVICFMFIGVQFSSAQTDDTVQEKVHKISTNAIPEKVKETLKTYSGYTISKEATFVKKSDNSTVYTFKIKKGIWVNYLLVDENGKIKGIKSQEGER